MTRDLEGRRYAITGANTGIGRATAEALAARGADVVIACRSAARARGVLDALGDAGALVDLDLADLDSVRRGAEALAALGPYDALINNAGVGGTRGVTKDGFELAFGVNHLGHYLLTRTLAPAFVVHVTSGSHERVERLDLDRVRGPTRSWTGLPEYAASKLCTMLFHHELDRRGVASVAADPGDVASDGWRHVPWPVRPLLTWRMKSPEQGASTPVYCAADAPRPEITGKLFCDSVERAPSPLSLDAALATELWERSAAWTGLSSDGQRTNG